MAQLIVAKICKRTNIFKKLFLSKESKQRLFLEELEHQKNPLTPRQFKKLTKCTLPPEKTYQEFMFEWAAKSQQKQDAQDKFVADAIKLLADAYMAREIQQRYREAQEEIEPHNNNIIMQSPKNKVQTRGILRAVAMCVCCLAIGITSLFGDNLFGSGGDDLGDSMPPKGGNIVYQAAPPIAYSNLSEFYNALKNENIPFFSLIQDEVAFAEYEADANDSTLILGYQIQGLAVMASDGNIYYPANFKITTRNYEFADYEIYQNLAGCFNNGVIVKFEINETNNQAFINFSYENFCYYIYLQGVDTITQANIQTLIEDLNLNI